jgi:ribonuclease T2
MMLTPGIFCATMSVITSVFPPSPSRVRFMRTKLFVIALFALSCQQPVYALVKKTGEFVARDNCPAVVSIRKGTNPGQIKVRPGQRYTLRGYNAPKGGYVQLEIPGAVPALRWVAKRCGAIGDQPDRPGSPGVTRRYVLAISWQPAFCEIKPGKPECRSQQPDRFDGSHFSLHGLWPQPRSAQYCGVSAQDRGNDTRKRWDRLPKPAIGAETARQLQDVMPGVASKLDRHEYIKHGTCFPDNADAYFRTALSLIRQINDSPLRSLVAGRIGQTVTVEELQAAFEQRFGAGTRRALAVHCIGDVDSRRTLVNELQINLRGALAESSKLEDVLDTAAGGNSNCDSGIIDPVGLN